MVHKVDIDSQPQLLSRLSCLVHDDVATRHCLSPFMLCREGILVAGRMSLDGSCVCLKQHCYSLQLSLYLKSYPPTGFDPFTDSQCYEICVNPHPICSCKLGRSYTALLADWIWDPGLHLIPESYFAGQIALFQLNLVIPYFWTQ